MSARTGLGLFWGVVAFRCLGAAIAALFVNSLVPLGTPVPVICLFGMAGIVGASLVSRSRLTSLAFVASCLALSLGPPMGAILLNWLLSIFGLSSLLLEDLGMHLGTCGVALFAAAMTTWMFWRVRAAVTAEAIVMLAISVLLFAGHRDLNFDRPKVMNSLAWRLEVDPLAMLIIVGTILVAATLAYLYLASLAARPRADEISVRQAPGRRQLVLTGLMLAGVVTLVIGIERGLYAHFSALLLGRVSNGVGSGAKEGVSPLTFQSALGASSQPTALVRLEGDYTNNPFSPVLYLRETALSSFNGHELVFAGRAFDTDIAVSRPNEPYTGKEDPELGGRKPLVQSVYLIANHDNPFAVDYPVSIVQLKNPKPTRFKGAYRAYSIAPAFELESLAQHGVGDPRWTEEVRQHYLTPHPDPRYKDLALKVTSGLTQPVEQAEALARYLSKTSIYTLTPRHEVKAGDDQVAPFLFGDHRGYCVHFAHAMVYLMRSLGIPARIGTGYFTDLSQSKDGHILLRMSDRHAWPEVFVTGVGWVPFDVQPEQVENHAETQVDPKLLEELMGILQPDEELLPQELVKDEKGFSDEGGDWLPNPRRAIPVAYLLLAAFVAAKLFLRFGWRVAPTPRLKLRLAYISAASALCDAGVSRELGETRLDFAARVALADLTPLARLAVEEAFAPSSRLASRQVQDAMAALGAPLARLPLWRRALAALSPASVVKAASGGGW